ncbi:unnamed protein product [Vitrella brassicaformis CCMP3155]|uniref:P-type ATPase A domain-containing protein n=3 Tax=Vitrella brassicaformis TaxID=1169539 RepID=A0A0G4ESB2_VITBC|nr:unnamed protein product [Vitrella brassicaformis CCMP3155]|eukprot:CEM01515.1 unnamed protein product [Vitrella brassicaformis CCMP3155]
MTEGGKKKSPKRFVLYRKIRSPLRRLDVWPFIFLYACLGAWLLYSLERLPPSPVVVSSTAAADTLANATTANLTDEQPLTADAAAAATEKMPQQEGGRLLGRESNDTSAAAAGGGQNATESGRESGGGVGDLSQTIVQEICLLVAILLHALTHLSTHWSVHANALIAFRKVRRIESATHVKVCPSKPMYKTLLCPIEDSHDGVSILYQKKRLFYTPDAHEFHSIAFPVNMAIPSYFTTSGLSGSLEPLQRKYGINNYDIPIPEFWELFKEHIVAPFFVFQFVCVVLWLLDEYWYYSLMTLVMLIFLEAQLVNRRRKDLEELKSMRLKSINVNAYRQGEWVKVKSDDLLPGDIIAISRSSDPDASTCPCDALLLQGTVVMNEAMLTGESVPQMKVAIEKPDDQDDQVSERLDVKHRHKQFVLFSGTKVVMHKNEEKGSEPYCKKMPRGACLAYVLRTGFNTTQGKLVRTILFSSERVTLASLEAIMFLLILLVCAVAAAGYVLVKGLEEGDRGRFKLFLSCSHIITSVVPPEFPITLSLAVTLSLVAFVQRQIYCTEPFRVPFAGKVDVCAFDKTGTLTSDKMHVDGVYGLSNPKFKPHPPDKPPQTSNKTSASTQKPTAPTGREGGGGEDDDRDDGEESAATTNGVRRRRRASDGQLMDRAGAGHDETVRSARPPPLPPSRARPTTRSTSTASTKAPSAASGQGQGGKGEDENDHQGPLEQCLPFMTTAVMAGCTSLATVEEQLVGDPMEKAALTCVQWHMNSVDVVTSKRKDRLTIVHRWPFLSENQRMTVVAKHEGNLEGWSGTASQAVVTAEDDLQPKPNTQALLVLVKGSAERLRGMLRKVPHDYDTLHKSYSMQGYRILCMAAKWIDSSEVEGGYRHMDRKAIESGLVFAGFLVLGCPVKRYTERAIGDLRKSYHSLMMITGDNPLTACQVALDLNIANKTVLILSPKEELNGRPDESTAAAAAARMKTSSAETLDGDAAVSVPVGRPRQDNEAMLEWRSRDGTVKMPLLLDGRSVRQLARTYDLCMPGPMLRLLKDKDASVVIPHVCVFARVSPQQKEQVIVSLNSMGRITLMCGDGTNDVGALKAAHVGVSLLSSPVIVARPKAPPATLPPPFNRMPPNKLPPKLLQQLQEQERDGPPIVRLGDASAASPFTYKGDNIRCVTVILRGGRATLAAVVQLYKILALNSLITAFGLSVLTLDGVKLGDAQATIENLYVSFLFFFISKATPSKKLSPERPVSSVFAPSVLLSIVGQAAIHFTTLIWGWKTASELRPIDYKPDLEGEFSPNLTNTVVFFLIASMHVSSFLANYEGAPFMLPFFDNKLMLYGVGIFIGVLGILVTETVPDLNELFSLVKFPTAQFRHLMTLLVLLDIGGTWLLATVIGIVAKWVGRWTRVHGWNILI